MTADEVQNYGKRYGRTWTTEDLKMKIRKVEVLNFAKRKKAGLVDDIHDKDWGPVGDASLKDYLTGYHAAMDDLHIWVMGQYEAKDGK